MPASVLACSPPFEQPTIKALGPGQVVVVGMTGERVAGGRLFHVSRWFNGPAPTTPILIDFKEGAPVGDCSYPIGAGVPLIIAPLMDGGRLSADLATLQADPASDLGRGVSHRGGVTVRAWRRAGRGADSLRRQARNLSTPHATFAPDRAAVAAFLVVSVTSVFVGVVVLARRRSSSPA